MANSSSIRNTPSARAEVVLEAAWEIEGIAELVIKHLSNDAEDLAYRSLMRRTKRLACLIMSAISEVESVDMPELESMLNDGEVACV